MLAAVLVIAAVAVIGFAGPLSELLTSMGD
jgi:hypothetical protein